MTTIEDQRKNLIDSFDEAERGSFEKQLRQWEKDCHTYTFDMTSVQMLYPDPNRCWPIISYTYNYLQNTIQTQLRTPSLKRGRSNSSFDEDVREGGIPSMCEEPTKPPWMKKSAVDLLQEGIQDIIDSKGDVAPFIFLLQSIGYGKTKAVWDLAKKRRVVYLPCKDIDTYSADNEYWKVPKSLKETISYLDKKAEQTCEQKWRKFLESVVGLADQYSSVKELYDAQITGDGKLANFYKRITYDAKSPFQGPSILRKNKKQKNGHEPASVRFKETNSNDSTKAIDNSSLVVCLDEATALSKPSFHAFQRAAKRVGIIAIFSDTSISKIEPPLDASRSLNGGDLGRSLTPMFRIPNFDLECCNYDSDDLENLFKTGRPLWSNLLRVTGDDDKASDDDLFEMVQKVQKILTRNDNLQGRDRIYVDFHEENRSERFEILPSMIAVFACRFGLGYTSSIGSLLAKYNLATISYVSENLERLDTYFPSEPIVAEASASYTKHQPNMDTVLKHVSAAVQGGLLDPPRGDFGEMCAAALMGFTMDKIRRESHDGDYFFFSGIEVDLHEFLKKFGCLQTPEISNALEGWKVNFTHFVRPSLDLDQRDLKEMWFRRNAFYVPKGLSGLDLLITMKHATHGYATLRVQVKNQIPKSEQKRAFAKLAPNKCLPNVPGEKLAVCLLLCTEVETHCELWDYKVKRRLYPEPARMGGRSQRNQPEVESFCLQLASNFVTDLNREDSFAKTLLDICKDEEDVTLWMPDEARTEWEENKNAVHQAHNE